MRTLILLLGLWCSYGSLAAQSQMTYGRAKVLLNNSFNIEILAGLGIEVEHGAYLKHQYFISDFSYEELQTIQKAGFKTEIIIEDVIEHYISQEATSEVKNNEECLARPAYNYQRPENFEFGSMMGYFTYQEMLEELNRMVDKFPNLISIKQPIDTFRTYDNQPIYWIQISDNPNEEETEEPQVLYTALHHAREPVSLSQLIYFMWYILERYDSDETIRYLVDHTAMYFIPCINPDGYQYNQIIRPEGGGLWRKNKRDSNGNGRFDGAGDGVDLNRNYGFQWGYNNLGSSPNPNSDTYRGLSSFSEPETQAVRFFCETHEFKLALNYHSFSDLLIYPWGYSDELTEGSEQFIKMGNELAKENKFLKGTATQTVGYNVNGTSDDWMYQATSNKSNIFAMTPEVGPSYLGFWPPSNMIEMLCQSTLLKNITAAHLVHAFPVHQELTSKWITATENELEIIVANIGLQEGVFSTTVKTIPSEVSIYDTTYAMGLSSENFIKVPVLLSNRIENGDTLLFEVVTSNGLFTKRDTIVKIFQNANTILDESFDEIAAWRTSSWGLTENTFYSASSSMTDSPDGNYKSNQFSELLLNQAISLTDVVPATKVRLQFKAKWELEPRYDYVQVQISFDNLNYIPLCGKYSTIGESVLSRGQAVYSGFQPNWIFEDIDITDLVLLYDELLNDSLSVRIKFQLFSDGDQEYDGFYVDDLEVKVSSSADINTAASDKIATDYFVKVYPNPSSQNIFLNIEYPYQQLEMKIYDSYGSLVDQRREYTGTTFAISLANKVSGVYFLKLVVDGQILPLRKLVIMK